MLDLEHRAQLRGLAVALILLAVFTLLLIADELGFRLPLPLARTAQVGFMVFNLGMVFGLVGLGSRGLKNWGVKRACEAVLINLGALTLREFGTVWVGLSAGSTILLMLGAFSLFKSAEAART